MSWDEDSHINPYPPSIGFIHVRGPQATIAAFRIRREHRENLEEAPRSPFSEESKGLVVLPRREKDLVGVSSRLGP